jgi:hypothetical protein
MQRPRDLFVKALDQTRLADASLADDQRYLALTIEDTFPPIYERAQFDLAPDERCEPCTSMSFTWRWKIIDHTRTKVKSSQTNDIVERFHKTVLNEFYRVTFQDLSSTRGFASRSSTAL